VPSHATSTEAPALFRLEFSPFESSRSSFAQFCSPGGSEDEEGPGLGSLCPVGSKPLTRRDRRAPKKMVPVTKGLVSSEIESGHGQELGLLGGTSDAGAPQGCHSSAKRCGLTGLFRGRRGVVAEEAEFGQSCLVSCDVQLSLKFVRRPFHSRTCRGKYLVETLPGLLLQKVEIFRPVMGVTSLRLRCFF
jgi:hypothetical protein